MGNVVVVGAQWGDEGKGKIVDWLSEQADVVVRFQGGHNAGHTLVIDGQIKTPFQAGDSVTIRRAEVEFQLARIPGHSFYGTLHRKLGWAGQPRYQQD